MKSKKLKPQHLSKLLQEALIKNVDKQAWKDWAKTPNLVSPKVELKPRVLNSPAWYVLINNMVRESKRLVRELAP